MDRSPGAEHDWKKGMGIALLLKEKLDPRMGLGAEMKYSSLQASYKYEREEGDEYRFYDLTYSFKVLDLSLFASAYLIDAPDMELSFSLGPSYSYLFRERSRGEYVHAYSRILEDQSGSTTIKTFEREEWERKDESSDDLSRHNFSVLSSLEFKYELREEVDIVLRTPCRYLFDIRDEGLFRGSLELGLEFPLGPSG